MRFDNRMRDKETPSCTEWLGRQFQWLPRKREDLSLNLRTDVNKSQALCHVLLEALRMWRQLDPWDSLAGELRLVGEFQAKLENLSQKTNILQIPNQPNKQTNKSRGKDLRDDIGGWSLVSLCVYPQELCIYMHFHTCTYAYTQIHMYTHRHTQMHTYTHTHRHTQMHMYTHTHRQTYTHRCIHTHTHTHRQRHRCTCTHRVGCYGSWYKLWGPGIWDWISLVQFTRCRTLTKKLGISFKALVSS